MDWVMRPGGCWQERQPVLLHADGPQPLALPELPASLIGFATSGSSGVPKWIGLTREALLTSAEVVNAHLGVTPTSCWGLALPWHHVGGFGVLARAWHSGCRLATFNRKWQPLVFAEWLSTERVSHTSLVPTQVHDLVVQNLHAPPGLMAVVVGGGKLDPLLAHRAHELGWPVLASYGMTEAASQIATQSLAADGPMGDGVILPVLPHWQVRLDASQRLEISGPALFAGTLASDGHRWHWQPRHGDWFLTQDVVELHPNGIQPLGRADCRLKVLGELVDPQAIEAELLSLSDGSAPLGSLAVTAEADSRTQHRLVLVVTPAWSASVIAELLDRYHAQAPGFRKIHRVFYIDAIPLSPLGKIRRAELAAWVAAQDNPLRRS